MHSLVHCHLSFPASLDTNIHYTFKAILTLCACTPPLDQVLLLWDFLLAFGVHLNVLCVIAQLLLMREAVMSSSSCVSLYRLILAPTQTLTVVGRCVFSARSRLWTPFR